jgi:hypothetical protein
MLRRIFAVNSDSSEAMSEALQVVRKTYDDDLETRIVHVDSLLEVTKYPKEDNVADIVFVEDDGVIQRFPTIDTFYAIGRRQGSDTSPSPTPEHSVSFSIDKGEESLLKGIETAAGRAYNRLLRHERGTERKGVVTIVGASGRVGVESTRELAAKFLKEGRGRVQLLNYGDKMDSVLERLEISTDAKVTEAYDKGFVKVVDVNEMLDSSQIIIYVPSVTSREVLDRFDQFKMNWPQVFAPMIEEEMKHQAAQVPVRLIGSGYSESIARQIHSLNEGRRFPIITYCLSSQDQVRTRAALSHALRKGEIPKQGRSIDEISLLESARMLISGTHRAPFLLPDSSFIVLPDGNGGERVSLRDAYGIKEEHVRMLTRKVQESAVHAYRINESPDEFTLAIPYTVEAIMRGEDVHLSVPFSHTNNRFAFSADRLRNGSSMAVSLVSFKDPAKPKSLYMSKDTTNPAYITLSDSERDMLLGTIKQEDHMHQEALRGLAHTP